MTAGWRCPGGAGRLRLACIITMCGHWAAVLQDASAQDLGNVRGLVRAVDSAAITTDLALRVARVAVRDGMAFKAGDALIEFDCSRPMAEASIAEAQLAEAQLTLDSNRHLERRQAVGRFDVEIAAARVARAQGEVNVHRARLAQCVIVAPFHGRVAELAIKPHEQPQPGRPLITIVGTERIEIELIMPSRQLQLMASGQTFSFAIDELARSFEARIDRLGAAIDPVSQMVKLYAVFVDAPPEVLPGMSGSAQFRPGTR